MCSYIQQGGEKVSGLTLLSKERESYFTTGGLCVQYFLSSEVLFFKGWGRERSEKSVSANTAFY